MNISLNWLTDYVDVTLPAAELGELFTRIGLNLEGIAETDADIVLDLEVTSNRPDCLGHLGVARELATATTSEFRPPTIGELPTEGAVQDVAAIEVAEPDLCPRYTARVIRNVKVGPSPSWLRERLEAVGLRSVNNVVDVTNYILMEYAQPLHAFDLDKLDGQRIVVRRATKGEKLVSIDQTTCPLEENMLVIADATRPVAIAGIMGGLDTEVSESTTHVLIEAAQFDPLNIRKTSRKLGLSSESNYRFERGVDPVAIDEASLRACQLILDLAGGELAEGMLDAWAQPWQPGKVALRPERTNALLGIDVPADRQMDLLARLGLEPEMQDGKIVCTTLPYRKDLTREADLIEEVARLVGYDEIPTHSQITHAVTPECQVQRLRKDVARVLNAAGYDEAMSFTFIDADEAKLLGHDDHVDVDTLTRKTNNTLRPTLVPSLLDALKTNQDAGNGEVRLFELAAVFPRGKGSALPAEYRQVALATTGDLQQLRGAMETLADRAVGETLEFAPAELPGYADGASAEVRLDGEPVGQVGIISQAVQDRYGLEKPGAVGWVNFEALLARAGKTATYQPVPRFPASQRDLSVIVDEATTWRQLADAVAAVDQPLRESLDYVTTYRGKPVAKGKKSVTMSLTYRSESGTLRSEQVDEQVDALVGELTKRLGAELRK